MLKKLSLSIAALVWALPALAQYSGSPIVPTTVVDPIFSACNAAGVTTATFGNITSGTRSLAVNQPLGWKVGMGISIANAGAGGTTELITKITAIAGTTFTLDPTLPAASATASGQSVRHDDTAALQCAINSGLPVSLSAGTYNVTSTLLVSNPITFKGAGSYQSFIANRATATDVFQVSYQTALGLTFNKGALFEDFQIYQVGTPTAGYGFNIFTLGGATSPTFFLNGLAINRVNFFGLWGGITTGYGLISNWFTNLYMANLVGGWGVYYNTPQPAGDNHWNDIEMSGFNTGFQIVSSDTQIITNLKLNESGLLFSGSQSTIDRVRIVNPSIEGSGTIPSCAVDFGASGTTQVQIIGGEIALVTNTFCNLTTNAGLQIIGVNAFNSSGGPVNQNYNWIGSPPVFSGCATNGTAIASTYSGAVSMTCTAATMVMTMQPAPTGWKCDVRDITNPADLIAQSNYSSTQATFANTTTGTAAVLVYSCTSF
jgi:hypothetical protein